MNKDEAIKESKKQLQRFKKELEELKETTAHLSVEAKKQLDIGANELEKLYSEADVKFDELKSKAEANYQDAKAFIDLTNKALKHSFNYFMSHYRKK
jgi:hypothetical protein